MESCPHRQNGTRVQTPSYSIAKLRVRERDRVCRERNDDVESNSYIHQAFIAFLASTLRTPRLFSPHSPGKQPFPLSLSLSLFKSVFIYVLHFCVISTWFDRWLLLLFRVLYVAIIHTFILLRNFISFFIIKGFWISDEHGSWECCHSPQEFGFVTYPRPYCWQMGWCTWQKDYQGLSKLTIFIFSFWVGYGSSTN